MWPRSSRFAGPFPAVRFCPTGGIALARALDYLALANVACVGGAWMVPADLIANRDWGAITALASGGVDGDKPSGSGRGLAGPRPRSSAQWTGPAERRSSRSPTRSGASTWSITMCAAPITPAMWPSSVSAISRWRDATGVALR